MLFSRMLDLPKRPQDGDGEDRNGDRGSDGETSAKADVNRDGSEDDSKEGTKDQSTCSEFGASLDGRNKGLKDGPGGCRCCHGGGVSPLSRSLVSSWMGVYQRGLFDGIQIMIGA